MRNTKDKEKLQGAGLSAVLLLGSYGVSGRIMAPDPASYTQTWLWAGGCAAVVWLAATYLPSRSRSKAGVRPLPDLLAALYLTACAGLYLRGLAALWRQWALPQTPRLVPALALALLTVYGASRGLRPVLRLSLPVLFTLSLFFLLDTALLIPEMSTSRLSLAYADFYPTLFGALTAALLLPLPAALLLTKGQGADRSWFRGGALLGLAYLILSAVRSVLLLGPLAVLEPYPLLRSLMLVYVGPALNRMEAWGLMALSAAMATAAMALAAGALARQPFRGHEKAAWAALAGVLTAIAFF